MPDAPSMLTDLQRGVLTILDQYEAEYQKREALYIGIGLLEIHHWIRLEGEYQVYISTKLTKLIDRRTWYDFVILGYLL